MNSAVSWTHRRWANGLGTGTGSCRGPRATERCFALPLLLLLMAISSSWLSSWLGGPGPSEEAADDDTGLVEQVHRDHHREHRVGVGAGRDHGREDRDPQQPVAPVLREPIRAQDADQLEEDQEDREPEGR